MWDGNIFKHPIHFQKIQKENTFLHHYVLVFFHIVSLISLIWSIFNHDLNTLYFSFVPFDPSTPDAEFWNVVNNPSYLRNSLLKSYPWISSSHLLQYGQPMRGQSQRSSRWWVPPSGSSCLVSAFLAAPAVENKTGTKEERQQTTCRHI